MIHEILEKKTSTKHEETMSIKHTTRGMAPIIQYFMQGVLSEEINKARCIKKVSTRYLIVSDKLYKMGRSTPMLRCVTEIEITLIMREVHEGICDIHIIGRALSEKILRAGYYWPQMLQDCAEFVSKFDKC